MFHPFGPIDLLAVVYIRLEVLLVTTCWTVELRVSNGGGSRGGSWVMQPNPARSEQRPSPRARALSPGVRQGARELICDLYVGVQLGVRAPCGRWPPDGPLLMHLHSI